MGTSIYKQYLIFLFLVIFGGSVEAQSIFAESFKNPQRNRVLNIPTFTGSDFVLCASCSQVVTNKDIDGGTASNTNRVTVPKNTTSNLNGLTRKQGTIVYDTTTNVPNIDDGTSLMTLNKVSYSSISTSQTATVAYDVYAVNATSGSVTVTLPTLASSLGKVFIFKKTDSSANAVVIDGNSTEQVEGGNTFSLFNQNDTAKIANIGTSWVVISANIQKEAASFNGGTNTVSCTANTWVTAPLTITSDSTRYPLSSNTFTIRKTAHYCMTVATDFGANSEAVYVGFSVNGGADTYLTEHAMDANSSGSRSQFSETSCRNFTAGDVLRLRVRVNTNTRTCQAHMFTIWEM